MDLFDYQYQSGGAVSFAPLADRLRPDSLDSFIGQAHIVGKGMLMRRAISMNTLGSCIFYGPPGVGKTTLAHIISKTIEAHCEYLNAVSSGVADCKRVFEEAEERQKLYGKRTVLILDECHRFSKSQSDCLLPAIEKGVITFIGSTTENPYHSMTPAIVSRCRVFEFKRLSKEDVGGALADALKRDKVLSSMQIVLQEEAKEHFVWAAGGDLRCALNALELAAMTTPKNERGEVVITKEVAASSIQKPALSVDETLYYDMLSAFCKSLRGSDPDSALYYMERLIAAGCDPLLIARRLVAHASEDVGLADSHAMPLAVSAMLALERMGLPEGRIPLAHAVIYVCTAPKSNSVICALEAAHADATQCPDDFVPLHLRNHYRGDEAHAGYRYPHDYGGWVDQQYLPDSLKDRIYYRPGKNGAEAAIVLQKHEGKGKKPSGDDNG